jgi:hypothetical protein
MTSEHWSTNSTRTYVPGTLRVCLHMHSTRYAHSRTRLVTDKDAEKTTVVDALPNITKNDMQKNNGERKREPVKSACNAKNLFSHIGGHKLSDHVIFIIPIITLAMTSAHHISFLICLLALLQCSSFVSGWGLPKPSPGRKTTVERYYSLGIDDHTAQYVTDISTYSLLTPPPSLELPIRSVDLPKHSPSREVLNGAKLLWDFEIIVGRAAMLTSLLFFVGEVFCGWSMSSALSAGIF